MGSERLGQTEIFVLQLKYTPWKCCAEIHSAGRERKGIRFAVVHEILSTQ